MVAVLKILLQSTALLAATCSRRTPTSSVSMARSLKVNRSLSARDVRHKATPIATVLHQLWLHVFSPETQHILGSFRHCRVEAGKASVTGDMRRCPIGEQRPPVTQWLSPPVQCQPKRRACGRTTCWGTATGGTWTGGTRSGGGRTCGGAGDDGDGNLKLLCSLSNIPSRRNLKNCHLQNPWPQGGFKKNLNLHI